MGRARDTCGGEGKCLHVFLWGSLTKRDKFETLDLHGKMILKWIITDCCMWFILGQVMDCCKHGNKLPQQ